MNKIKRAAKKYIKATNGNNLSSAIDYLSVIGYSVIFFNTSPGDEAIRAYGLEWEKDTLKAFTCHEVNGISAVFIDNNLHINDKLYLILHEIGHILLGHVGDGHIAYRDQLYSDIEADAFAFEVLNYKGNASQIISTVCAVVLGITIGFAVGLITTSGNQIHDITTLQTFAAENNVVYITPTGTKYHRDTCIYAQNKDCAEMSKNQADKIYEACRVCNP